MRLRRKLALLMSALGAALVVVVLLLVDVLFTRHIQGGARDDIADAGTSLRQSLGRKLESYQLLGHVVSNETILKEALVGGSKELAFTYVDSVYDRTGAEYLILADADGKVVTDRKKPERAGEQLGLAALRFKAGFILLDGTLVAAAVVPVTLGGRTIGSLLLGETVTRQQLTEAQATQSSLTLLVDKNKPISTLTDADAGAIVDAAQGCSPSRMGTIEELEIGGAPNLVALQPLTDMSGTRLGCIALTRSLAEPYGELRRMERWLFGLGLLITIVGMLVARVISAHVVDPIGKLTVAARIVKDGDFTQKIEVGSRDEIGDLAQVFAELVDRLREIPESLRESVELLSASVENLSMSAVEQSTMIASQAAALHEMQATVNEIKQTSRTAADKAAGVVRVAQRAEELDRVGGAAIESTLKGLADVHGEVGSIAEQIGQLAERARQIGNITETVKDLADQSNMLALNAAIEAVRSGEHGKGFTVVAREIRSLADQSIQATNHARSILGEVGNAIRLTVTRTDTGMQKMEAGLVQARASGESLRELSEIVRDNFAAVRQIGAVVSQQNAGVAQMSGAVGDLSKMMDGIVERIDATNRAVADLRVATRKVTELVQRFRS